MFLACGVPVCCRLVVGLVMCACVFSLRFTTAAPVGAGACGLQCLAAFCIEEGVCVPSGPQEAQVVAQDGMVTNTRQSKANSAS
jgi:hypothetical protein